MTFTMSVDMDNAAFEDDPLELSDCLGRVLQDVLRSDRPTIGDGGPIRDVNGNRVGQWEITS